jgi:hypothetical protein
MNATINITLDGRQCHWSADRLRSNLALLQAYHYTLHPKVRPGFLAAVWRAVSWPFRMLLALPYYRMRCYCAFGGVDNGYTILQAAQPYIPHQDRRYVKLYNRMGSIYSTAGRAPVVLISVPPRPQRVYRPANSWTTGAAYSTSAHRSEPYVPDRQAVYQSNVFQGTFDGRQVPGTAQWLRGVDTSSRSPMPQTVAGRQIPGAASQARGTTTNSSRAASSVSRPARLGGSGSSEARDLMQRQRPASRSGTATTRMGNVLPGQR